MTLVSRHKRKLFVKEGMVMLILLLIKYLNSVTTAQIVGCISNYCFFIKYICTFNMITNEGHIVEIKQNTGICLRRILM